MAFGFLKKVVRTAGRATRGAVKGVGKGVQGVGRGVGTVGKTLGEVPVVGQGLRGAFQITAAAPFQVASDISKGKRIDKVAAGALKRNVAAVKDVAPYAQMVISNVPGVGQGVSGAISAGLTLASGQPITQAIADGVRGALPGGPLVKSAFDLGSAAVQGKPINKVIIASLPIPASQKTALSSGLAAVSNVAAGRKIDEVLLNAGQSALSPDIRKALNAGIAIAQGQKLQKLAPQILKPDVIPRLSAGGANLIKASPVLQSAGALLDASARQGYTTGIGLMAQRVVPIQLTSIRAKLTPAQRKGFDLALATRIGMTTKPAPAKATPAQQLGYYAAAGMNGLPQANKISLLKTVAGKPDTLAGAAVAVREAKKENSVWWRKVLRYVGFKV